METDSPAEITPLKAIQLASIVSHVRANNVSYLLCIAIGHMLGLTEQVISYGQGMC